MRVAIEGTLVERETATIERTRRTDDAEFLFRDRERETSQSTLLKIETQHGQGIIGLEKEGTSRRKHDLLLARPSGTRSPWLRACYPELTVIAMGAEAPCGLQIFIREAIIVVAMRQPAGKDSPKGRLTTAPLKENDSSFDVQHVHYVVGTILLDVSLKATDG